MPADQQVLNSVPGAMPTHRLLDLLNLLEEYKATHRGALHEYATFLIRHVREEAMDKELAAWKRSIK